MLLHSEELLAAAPPAEKWASEYLQRAWSSNFADWHAANQLFTSDRTPNSFFAMLKKILDTFGLAIDRKWPTTAALTVHLDSCLHFRLRLRDDS